MIIYQHELPENYTEEDVQRVVAEKSAAGFRSWRASTEKFYAKEYPHIHLAGMTDKEFKVFMLDRGRETQAQAVTRFGINRNTYKNTLRNAKDKAFPDKSSTKKTGKSSTKKK